MKQWFMRVLRSKDSFSSNLQTQRTARSDMVTTMGVQGGVMRPQAAAAAAEKARRRHTARRHAARLHCARTVRGRASPRVANHPPSISTVGSPARQGSLNPRAPPTLRAKPQTQTRKAAGISETQARGQPALGRYCASPASHIAHRIHPRPRTRADRRAHPGIQRTQPHCSGLQKSK